MADKLEGHDSAIGRSIPYPEDNGALWDRVVLGPHVLPGTWMITGSSKRRIDVKTTRGSDGARFRDQGYEPAPLTLVGKMVGATDWNEMVRIGKLLQPRKRGKAMEPLAADHPTFTYLGITNVLVREVFAPVVDGGQVTASISVLEWMPRPKPKPKPKDIPVSQSDANRRVTGGAEGLTLRGLTFANRNLTPASDTPTYFAPGLNPPGFPPPP